MVIFMRVPQNLAVLAIILAGLAEARADCPAPLAIVQDITADRFYTDAASSVVDDRIVARNKASLRALDDTLKPILKASDQALTGDAVVDPTAFARLAGEPSVESPKGGILGWLAFYRARFPGRAKDGPEGPFRYRWPGGNLTLMAAKGLKD